MKFLKLLLFLIFSIQANIDLIIFTTNPISLNNLLKEKEKYIISNFKNVFIIYSFYKGLSAEYDQIRMKYFDNNYTFINLGPVETNTFYPTFMRIFFENENQFTLFTSDELGLSEKINLKIFKKTSKNILFLINKKHTNNISNITTMLNNSIIFFKKEKLLNYFSKQKNINFLDAQLIFKELFKTQLIEFF